MRKVLGGYTILEVMLFLTVSALLLIGAITAVGGTNAHTQFAQGMRDINSKVQSWANNVTNGFAGNRQSQVNCQAPGASAPLINKGAALNPTPDCIFLGKVLQFTTTASCPSCISQQSRYVYAYSLFGRRTLASDTSQLVTDINSSVPIPAVGAHGTGTADLTESYYMNGGIKILSIKTTAGAANSTINSQLVGFFNNLGTASADAANGSNDLVTYAYNLGGNQVPANQTAGGTLTNCLELTSASGCTLNGLDSFTMCFGNDNNSETALLTITSNNGLGMQTGLSFTVCS